MRKLAMTVVLAALFVPTLASAQLTLGARLGYAFPMGEIGEGLKLGDAYSSQIPLQLDVGFKVTPALTLGGYFGFGFAQVDEDCGDCSGRVYRVGAQLEYTFKSASMAPWVGAGIGYEWASITDDDAELKFSGFEYLNLQGGLDWRVGGKAMVGPFALVSFGRYSTFADEDIPGEAKTFHQWFQIGVRGQFDL